MKTTIVIIGLCVAIMGHALAQTNQIVAPIDTNAPIQALPVVAKPKPLVIPKEITTRAGTVYKNIKIERVDPGGLTVSYPMAGGGFGITKINFYELSPELQMQYGYDAQTAAAFQSGEKQAIAQWGAKMTADEKEAKIIIAEREKREEVEARQKAEAAAAAKKLRWAAELKEREIEAKERAAAAAEYQATHPPAIIQQQQQQQQGGY
jgi:hypothetical protein